jgi:hypothetical protein
MSGFPYQTITQSITGSSTSAYAANQVIGGLQTLTPVAKNGLLQGITLTAGSTVSAQVDFVLFTSSMPNTTFTNLSSIAISSQDYTNVGTVVNITNWAYAGTGCSVGVANGLAYAFNCPSQNLYYALIARAALTLSPGSLNISVTIVS